MAKPPVRQRIAARSAVLSTARSRKPHGHLIAVTPRPKFQIRPPPAAEAIAPAPATPAQPEVK